MENLIYIVLGIIFFIVQVYRESEKVKKKSRTSRQEPHLPEGQRYDGESFPAKGKTERETDSKNKRSQETIPDRLKNVNELKDSLFAYSDSFKKSENKPEKTENETIENSIGGKTLSSKNKTRSDNDYAGLFQTPQSVRSAFIASEIFNRKHF